MTRLASIVVLSVLLSGCTLGPLAGDRHFRADRLEEAEVAYRAFLEKRSSSARGGDRTLYRLGLIYSLRESPLYDPTKARQLLQELAQRPGPYGRQAALVLRLQLQVSELQQEATTHALLSASLEQELGRMEEEAAAASTVVGEQKDRTQRLTNEIEQLRAEIAALTQALDLKRQELTRIKEIDLERLP